MVVAWEKAKERIMSAMRLSTRSSSRASRTMNQRRSNKKSKRRTKTRMIRTKRTKTMTLR